MEKGFTEELEWNTHTHTLGLVTVSEWIHRRAYKTFIVTLGLPCTRHSLNYLHILTHIVLRKTLLVTTITAKYTGAQRNYADFLR